jgi:hypothetical protein
VRRTTFTGRFVLRFGLGRPEAASTRPKTLGRYHRLLHRIHRARGRPRSGRAARPIPRGRSFACRCEVCQRSGPWHTSPRDRKGSGLHPFTPGYLVISIGSCDRCHTRKADRSAMTWQLRHVGRDPSRLIGASIKPSDLADAAETRVRRGCDFRFVGARADERCDYRPRPRIFVRSPMKFAAAISRRDLLDLDSV